MRTALCSLLLLSVALSASAQRTTAPRTAPEAVRTDMRPILFAPDFTAESARRVRDARRAEWSAEGRSQMPALAAAFDARMGSRAQTAESAVEVALAVLHAHGRLAGRTQAEIDLDVFDLVLEASSDDLATVGEDAQLANVDLQNALQKQQQTLQMLTNVSKLLHDTAKAMINNIRG